jgi:hypothetical protein
MKRRDVMKVSAVTAGAAAGLPGCAVPRMMADLAGIDGARQFNVMLDEQTARMEGPGLLQRLLATQVPELARVARTPEAAAELDEKDELFRQMLGSLLITQGFRDLPTETQLEPAVQERMWTHMDEIGETVFKVGELLASLDGSQRDKVQQYLRDRPTLPMAMGEALDTQAAAAGISVRRRLQLRKMMTQASFRLRNGDPGAIIDEYAQKVQKVRARTTTDAEALAYAQQLGDKAFWRYQHLLQQQPDAAGTTGPPGGGPPIATPPPGAGPGVPPPGAAAPPTMPPRKPGRKAMKAGGFMFGIGVLVFGVSLLLVDTSEAFLVGGTIGAIMIAVGLLVLLIGAIIAAMG